MLYQFYGRVRAPIASVLPGRFYKSTMARRKVTVTWEECKFELLSTKALSSQYHKEAFYQILLLLKELLKSYFNKTTSQHFVTKQDSLDAPDDCASIVSWLSCNCFR